MSGEDSERSVDKNKIEENFEKIARSRRKYSFIILNAFFIAGILFFRCISLNVSSLLLVVSLFCFVLFFFFKFLGNFYFDKFSKFVNFNDIVCSIFLYILAFAIGTLFVRHKKFEYKYNNILRNIDGYICVSERALRLNKEYNTVECLVTHIKKNGRWTNVDDVTRIQVIFKSTEECDIDIFYGDAFLINSPPRMIIKDNRNPKQLSIYNYFTSKGIYFNHFIAVNEVKFLGNYNLFPVKNFFRDIQCYLKRKALSRIDDINSRMVISNLVFGKGDIIDRDLKNAYIKSGIVHILAISGLHIGMIFFIFSFLLSFFCQK